MFKYFIHYSCRQKQNFYLWSCVQVDLNIVALRSKKKSSSSYPARLKKYIWRLSLSTSLTKLNILNGKPLDSFLVVIGCSK